MSLIALNDMQGTRILLDMSIRAAADDPDDETVDVAEALRSRLDRDDQDRLYVSAFVQTHPDQDHIGGLRKHFHLGPPEEHDADSDKILINEIWSSPVVWRRADRRTGNGLCDDAIAFRDEARRRVNLYKKTGQVGAAGDRIRIIGEDEDGKTDGLEAILTRVNEDVTVVDGREIDQLRAHVLGPLLPQPE